MNKLHKIILVILLATSTFLNVKMVKADVAPPIQPPITNLEPGTDTTLVRMMAETVLIEVQPDTIRDSLGKAHITASFTMRNEGSADETLAVRFPISADNGRGEYPEIANLSILVNNAKKSFSRVNYPDIRWENKDVPWAEFQVSFPPDQDVNIEISYDLNGSGYAPFVAYYYLLETGAGWYGTIGSADIILRLPYTASEENVITNLQIGWSETSTGGKFDGNEVRWHFDDFEPGPEGPVQNMEFSIVAPEAWQVVLKAIEETNLHPQDGEAWGKLGMAYKRVFFMNKAYRTDPGGEQIYTKSVAAYEKCLSLKPEDAEWHAGFADLLANRAYWDSWNGPTSEAMRAIQEIHTALQLAPSDPIVLSIAETISYLFPDGLKFDNNVVDFPWLTQTPTPHPPTATIAVSFDPAKVSGEYQSEILTLTTQKKMQMTVWLKEDHSVNFEGRYDDGKILNAEGNWVDNGDGSIRINVKDENDRSFTINFLYEESDLFAIEYPGTFSGADWELKRVMLATATSTPTLTPAISTLTVTASQIETVQTKKPASPLCGSAVMIPIGMVAAFSIASRKFKGKETNDGR